MEDIKAFEPIEAERRKKYNPDDLFKNNAETIKVSKQEQNPV